MDESVLLVIGAILGIVSSIIGSVLIYRNAIRTHSEFIAKVLLEEVEIQKEISQLSQHELTLTQAGRELLVISPEYQDQFDNSVNATDYEKDLLDKTQILAEQENDWKTINPINVIIPDLRDILRVRDFNFTKKENFSVHRNFDYINPELSLE